MQALKRFIKDIFSDWTAKSIALVAAIVLFFLVGLTGLEERYISVPVRVVLPDNLVAGEEYPRFVRVYLRGVGDDIFSLTEDEISVIADFSGYDRPGIFRAGIIHNRLGKAKNMEPLEVRLEPGLLTVTLEEKAVAEVEVIPQINTAPASGFELTSYTAIPSQVRISGPRSAVENVVEIRTEKIDLSSQNNNFSTRVALIRPHPLVGFEDSSLVEFRAEIDESILVNNFDDIPLSITNLAPALRAELGGLRGTIRVQASQSLIDRTNPDTIGLLLDGSGISEAGEYVLPVTPVVPRGFVVFRFEPVELVVSIRESGE